MSLPMFCDACKARVEWHVTVAGKSMPIDPDPNDLGMFFFGPGLKLVRQSGMAKPRPGQKRYRCHWDTCPKGTEASKRGLARNGGATDLCDRFECIETNPHRHCFQCGDTEHFAADCPERES